MHLTVTLAILVQLQVHLIARPNAKPIQTANTLCIGQMVKAVGSNLLLGAMDFHLALFAPSGLGTAMSDTF
jgi:hypothetical protein